MIQFFIPWLRVGRLDASTSPASTVTESRSCEIGRCDYPLGSLRDCDVGHSAIAVVRLVYRRSHAIREMGGRDKPWEGYAAIG